MTLAKAKRLAPVVEMAVRDEREAARLLGQYQKQLAQAQAQLGDLEQYRGDYQQQWVEQGQRGVSGQWLMNYQRFLSQLETAIAQQSQSLTWHQHNLEKARLHWQKRHARLEALRKLVQRYQQAAQAVEDKREQKLLDELAQRVRPEPLG